MNPFKSLLGVFAVLGTWPNWESYFDLSRKGLKVSLIALAASLLPLWIVAHNIQVERARRLETEVVAPQLLPFLVIVGLWLFSFLAMVYLIGMLFEKMDRMRPWIITRNWAVFGLACVTGACFGLVSLGLLPFAAANGVAFAAYLGLLAIDIRLTQKVGEFKWGTAILIACVIVAVGLTFVQLSLSR